MDEKAPFRILVICTGNRARSQMAHGWLRHLGEDRVEVASAGVEPRGVHPLAIRAMADVGVDISAHTWDHVDSYVSHQFDLVLTVCDSAREKCPLFPGANRTLHRGSEDTDRPDLDGDDQYAHLCRIREEIGDFTSELLATRLNG
jgi:arsenate reductase